MPLPTSIQNFVVNLALSKGGPLLQKGVTLAASWLFSLGVNKIPGLDQYLNQQEIIGILWVLIDAAYAHLPYSIIKQYGKTIQAALNQSGAALKVDGTALAETAAATAKVTQQVSGK